MSAATLTGTLKSDSERRVAVTRISSDCGGVAALSAAVCAAAVVPIIDVASAMAMLAADAVNPVFPDVIVASPSVAVFQSGIFRSAKEN
ncbi:hypothetical protein [Novosphingobium capsulatum]|uniref:hypothetical protein n=1 Tax=Novosphingobium capsulatum TaxID=13688 RepID=UPI00286B2BD9|nr:hypothetical protein [Novosphingobium capsulatum]